VSNRSRGPAGRTGRRLPLFPIVIGAIVVALVVAVLATRGGDDDAPAEATGGETRPVAVTGSALPQFFGAGDDPAVGTVAPEVVGQDFAGRTVEIRANGNPKAVFFVAHWCPHCQAEVPRLASWLADNELPGDVEVYLVSTAVNAPRGNYPPSAWLRGAGVADVPTVADDEGSAALAAYGMGGFPYAVYLDAEHRVALRTSGEYPDDPEVYGTLFSGLAAGEPLRAPAP
jgi:thiol-disulfide isomerase/thioredoxin